MQAATETIRDLYREASLICDDKQRTWLAKHACKSEGAQRLRAMVELAENERGIPVTPVEFDADPWLLNVLNGTINLRTGELRPHRRNDLITKLAPVEYDPGAQSDLWNRFLERALPDPKARRFAKKAAGYTLLGKTGADVLFVVHGPPRTGKGTFQDALATALGEYAITAGLDDFSQRTTQGGPRPEIVRLKGARLVSIYETSSRLKLSASMIKTLAGSDPITARDLYSKPITFIPQCGLWIATNYRPSLPDDDAAIWERVRELPFTTVIPESERNPAVRAELRDPKASGAAVLAWAMEGCLAYQEEGLVAPETVKQATREYREEMDPLRDFFAECCRFGPELWVKSSDLREAYEGWCKENGGSVLDGNDFARRLRARGCEPKNRNVGRGWLGISLVSEEPMSA